MKEKILVCGAGGFIGSHLVKFLKEKGYWVRGVGLKYPEFSETTADEFFLSDLTKIGDCMDVVEGIDKIYQLAADMGGMGFISTHGLASFDNSLRINLNMAKAADWVRARILFSSSACVYPTNKLNIVNPQPIKEEDVLPAMPNEDYGWEKLTAEKIYQAYAREKGLDIRIVRYDNTYGEETNYKGGREKAPAAICRKVLEAKDSIEIWGDGEQTRAFMHVSDNNEGTWRLMESNVTEPINLATQELISINELVDIVCEISGKTLKKIYQLDKPQGVRGRLLNIVKAKELLDWEPKVSIREGMERTYKWLEKIIINN